MIYSIIAFLVRVRTFIQIKVFQKGFFIAKKTGKPVAIPKQQTRVFIAISHVVPNAQQNVEQKLPRLVECLDALIRSLANVHYKISLLTKEGCSLYEYLPAYLQKEVSLYFSDQQDPMFVGYDAFDMFKAETSNYDYYMFIEDDIIINDSWFLQKIKDFNAKSMNSNWILIPHRFEYYQGLKFYLDQHITIGDTSSQYTNSPETVSINDVYFCTYENPHAGFYCLNQEQLDRWITSKYHWKNKIVAFGPLETAATYCLFENFSMLKPHPKNINYFEIQHYGNKYMLQEKVLEGKNVGVV